MDDATVKRLDALESWMSLMLAETLAKKLTNSQVGMLLAAFREACNRQVGKTARMLLTNAAKQTKSELIAELQVLAKH